MDQLSTRHSICSEIRFNIFKVFNYCCSRIIQPLKIFLHNILYYHLHCRLRRKALKACIKQIITTDFILRWRSSSQWKLSVTYVTNRPGYRNTSFIFQWIFHYCVTTIVIFIWIPVRAKAERCWFEHRPSLFKRSWSSQWHSQFHINQVHINIFNISKSVEID